MNLNPLNVHNLLEDWKKGQNLLDQFWKTWTDEYIPSLRERVNRSVKQGKLKSDQTIKIGQVVLIKDEFHTRGNWKMGKIH